MLQAPREDRRRGATLQGPPEDEDDVGVVDLARAVLVRRLPDGEARHDEDHGDRRQPREEDDQEGMSPKRVHAPNLRRAGDGATDRTSPRAPGRPALLRRDYNNDGRAEI